MWRLWFIILGVVLLTSTAVSSYAATINAATCSAANVQSAINTAVTGDTVLVPRGSCNWDTISVPVNAKNITIQGAGIGVTVINTTVASGRAPFQVGLDEIGNSTRITGMTINVQTPGASAIIIDGNGWRIDHMAIKSTNKGVLCWGIWAYGHRTTHAYGPTGLVDHNQFLDCTVLVFGLADVAHKAGSFWVSDLGLGDGNAMYVEDNTWYMNGEDDMVDCSYGGRIVVRFNSTSGLGSGFNIHSNQGWRACRRWEFYNNSQTTSQAFFTAIELRGATGMVFQNAITGLYTRPMIFQNVRSASDAPNRPPLGQCDGTSFADGNVGTVENGNPGWPCRDQIGWNTDTFQWIMAETAPPQKHEPTYLWSNTFGGSPVRSIGVQGSPSDPNAGTPYIKENRDYYIDKASFNGTVGVGVGTLAARPSTCTTYGDGSGAGVGYWATDQADWNSKQAGPDGHFFRCSSTNTWTLYYTPSPYPHPLQAGTNEGGQPSPRAPFNLKVQ